MNVYLTLSGTLRLSADFFASMISAINDEKYSGIIVLIDSVGGNVNCVSPIVETIRLAQLCGKQVITVGLGTVASSAASIFVAGNRRIVLPNADFIIHRSHLSISQDDMEVDAKELLQLHNRSRNATEHLFNNLYTMTKLTPEVLERKLIENKDWYLTPEELMEYGIITEEYKLETLKELFIDDDADIINKVLKKLDAEEIEEE